LEILNFSHYLTPLFILSGAVLMALSIFSTRKLFLLLTDSRYRRYWQSLIIFMVLFQIGYVISLIFSILDRPEILVIFTGVIFFFGALFVLFVVRLGHLTISDLIQTTVSKSYIETILSTIPDVMIVATPAKNIRRVNKAVLAITGYKSYELLGKPLDQLFPNLHISPQECVDTIQNYEGKIRTKSGDLIHASLSISVICDSNCQILDYIILAKDITEHKNAEERLEFAASHDPLTGLPNRLLLHELLKDALDQSAVNPNYGFGVLFLDLDHFKDINDDHGHQIGDQLLASVARRLEGCVRNKDFVCRLGGDEFVILQTNESSRSNVKALSRRIIKEMNYPFELVGKSIKVSGSIGYLFCNSSYSDPSDVLRDADIALYSAKAAGRDCCQEFDPKLRKVR
jgi:diguanylate cyclase (GGDEF)-like protein/PAS domain S-box-containing protein